MMPAELLAPCFWTAPRALEQAEGLRKQSREFVVRETRETNRDPISCAKLCSCQLEQSMEERHR